MYNLLISEKWGLDDAALPAPRRSLLPPADCRGSSLRRGGDRPDQPVPGGAVKSPAAGPAGHPPPPFLRPRRRRQGARPARPHHPVEGRVGPGTRIKI